MRHSHAPSLETQNALCETTPLPWRKLQYPWDVNCRAAFIVTSSCTLRCSETQLSLAQFHCLERVCKCLFIVFRGLCKGVVCRWIVFVFSAFPGPVCRLAFFLTCTLHNIYLLSNFSIFNSGLGISCSVVTIWLCLGLPLGFA